MKSTMLIAVLSVSFLMAACQKGSSSGDSSGTPTPVVANGGGGIDTSGGDLMKASEEEVNQALANIESKTMLLLSRLSLIVGTDSKLQFNEEFGTGSYELMRPFVYAQTKELVNPYYALKSGTILFHVRDEACTEDNQAKDGSAYVGSDGRGFICLSRQGLRKLSPESIQLDILALAAHEISHVYGFDESKAQAVQKFILQNKSAVWPSDTAIADAKKVIEDILINSIQISELSRQRKFSLACVKAENMNQRMVEIEAKILKNSALRLPKALSFPILSLLADLQEINGACQNSKEAAIEIAIGKNIQSLIWNAQAMRMQVEYYQNPTDAGALVPTFAYMNLSVTEEDPAVLKAAGKEALAKEKLNIEDLYCTWEIYSKKDSPKQNPDVFQGQKFYEKNGGELGKLNIQMGSEMPFMIRKVEGQRGLSFGVITKEMKVESYKEGILTNGGTDTPVYAVNLIPGVRERFEVHLSYLEDPEAVLRIGISCEISKNKKPAIKWMDPNELKKVSPLNRRIEAINSSMKEDFEVSQPGFNLKIQLQLPTKKDTIGGPEVANQKVESLKYNGMIILEAGKAHCILSEKLIKDKGFDSKQLVEDLKNHKYSEVLCHMNGEQGSNGDFKTAAWAFDFSVH
jgi:hypothetical protein